MIGQLKQSLCSNGDVRDGEEGKRRERKRSDRFSIQRETEKEIERWRKNERTASEMKEVNVERRTAQDARRSRPTCGQTRAKNT